MWLVYVYSNRWWLLFVKHRPSSSEHTNRTQRFIRNMKYFFLYLRKGGNSYFKPVNMSAFNYYTIMLKTMKFQSWNASWVLTAAKNQHIFINSVTDVLVMDSARTTKSIHVNTQINVFQTYERLLNFFNLTEVPFCIWYGAGLQRQQDYCPDGGTAGTNGL